MQTVGNIPQGLSHFIAPDFSLIAQLWPGALGIALMSFTETIAAGRAFARRGEQPPWRQDTAGKVRAFIAEMGNVGECIRLEALYEQLWNAEDELKDRCQRYELSRRQDRPYIERVLIASFIRELETIIEKRKRQIRGIVAEAEGYKPKDRITEEMIEKAKEYPIESLITSSRRGNVLCIVHEEKHPSMSLKGNRARCFSCGYYGDSIDIYMKLNGVGFVDAVRKLCAGY